MLSRPTTEQVLLDCRAQLLATIDPAITDPQVKIAVQMMESVLRNCATRAAHEIAWMREEESDMIAYAELVVASEFDTPELAAALQHHAANRPDSLDLDEVSAAYSLAGECMSAAIEAVVAAGAHELERLGRALLDRRLAHELEIMGEWSMVGRG